MNASVPDPNRASIPGIVVTFFPDEGFEQRLAAIARETTRTIIVDNSSDEAVRFRLRRLGAEHGAELIENAENRGLGTALNQAFARIGEETKWAVTFDQDSTPEPGFTDALRQTASGDLAGIAVVGANWRDAARPEIAARHLRRRRRIPVLFERVTPRRDLDDVTCVITSGALFHVPTVRELGGFDEGLFLDLVDTDFCLRAQAAGRGVSVAAAARLEHRRGNKRPVKFCGLTCWTACMPASRLYYLFRNRMLLFGRHAWRFPHWVAFELIYAAKLLAHVIFLEESKLAKLAACARGTWHGLTGRTGRMPPQNS